MTRVGVINRRLSITALAGRVVLASAAALGQTSWLASGDRLRVVETTALCSHSAMSIQRTRILPMPIPAISDSPGPADVLSSRQLPVCVRVTLDQCEATVLMKMLLPGELQLV